MNKVLIIALSLLTTATLVAAKGGGSGKGGGPYNGLLFNLCI